MLTDRVHGMRGQFKHAVEDKVRKLMEEHVAPVPRVILDDIMRLGLHP